MIRTIRHLLALFALTLLASCGGGSSGCNVFTDPACGGNGGGGGGGGGTTAATITVAISSTTVSAAQPATVTATVRGADGSAIEGAVVQFTTTGGLGAFSAPSGLTGANGQAVVTLVPASATTSGADEVVASASVNGEDVSDTAGFQLSATAVEIASFTADIGAGGLSAYGQTSLTVALSGVSAGTPVNVGIASTCLTKGKATITPTSQSTTNGVAVFTYVDNGCGATDASDSVQINVVGGTATASLNLDLTSPNAASIAFVSATPERIFLKGSGYDEVAQVTFQVRDDAGNPLPGQSVVLEPTTLTGGLTLDGGASAVTKLSDSNGQVTARVNSGTVPTPVRVRATLTGPGISTVSSNLAIAVGLPAQLSFSLSQATLNIEGYNRDGTTNTYTVIASDRLGNPVPAGTTINYIVEAGGQIDTARQIVIGENGLASATAAYQSSEPRPDDGRITVVAYALGEESFLDANGNNVFDSSEDFQDLGDVFVSRDFVTAFDADLDQRIPLAGTGSAACRAASSSLLAKGLSIPSVDADSCDRVWSKSVYVRRATETVLSTSGASPLWGRSKPSGLDADCAPPIDIVDDTRTARSYYPLAGGLNNTGTSGTFGFLVSDANPVRLNPMAAGTRITVSTTDGLSARVTGGSPVPSSNTVTSASIAYTFAEDTTSGSVFINFTSPSGLTTTYEVPLRTGTIGGCGF